MLQYGKSGISLSSSYYFELKLFSTRSLDEQVNVCDVIQNFGFDPLSWQQGLAQCAIHAWETAFQVILSQ